MNVRYVIKNFYSTNDEDRKSVFLEKLAFIYYLLSQEDSQ